MLRSDVVPNVNLISSIFFVDKDFFTPYPTDNVMDRKVHPDCNNNFKPAYVGRHCIMGSIRTKINYKCLSRFSIYITLSKISQIGKSEMLTQTPKPSHVGRHFFMLPKF